ncbi:MAG: hypothetical protein LBC35_01000 [Coriobacteriales bacterium]|jgi:hypothetical protein|nr:hypothetical protein [Coriobacteriales bacterium]
MIPDFFSLSGISKTFFSVGGVASALALLLVVFLVFCGAFYRPIGKVQISKTKLLALLAASTFNLIVVFPFAIFLASPLKAYAFAWWWLFAWSPFTFASLFFLVFTVCFFIFRRWSNFPVTEERPVLSFFGFSVVFETLYIILSPIVTVVGAAILMSFNPDIFKTPLW